MNVEEYIIARVNVLMHTEDAAIVKRLEGGMSNYTYVVTTRGKKFTYRVPGKYAEKFVDRAEEWEAKRSNLLKIPHILNLSVQSTVHITVKSCQM